jgi:hypothetical protein
VGQKQAKIFEGEETSKSKVDPFFCVGLFNNDNKY